MVPMHTHDDGDVMSDFCKAVRTVGAITTVIRTLRRNVSIPIKGKDRIHTLIGDRLLLHAALSHTVFKSPL